MIALLLCGLMRLNAREAVNDLTAPESRKDLETIQKSVERVIPQARAATVCIEIDEGSGTGVIVSEDGLVLTAAHVATRVNKKATVILEDGTRLKAKTLGLVADKDAAMVQILDKGTYPFVEIDRAESTRLGDWVFSLGHAGGFDKERGSVVRLGRLVRIAGATFQSDCMLIGGDSGGPLFDLSGKLVGIHSRVGQQAQVNMHVPLAEFVANWDGLINGEFIGEGPYAEKPEKGNGYLGLATNSISDGGLIVTKVGLKSPAELAGIKNGDVLLKLNEVHLEKREQMQEMLKNLSAGDEVTFEIKRAGKFKIITFNLGER
jgi:serine protease Do